MNDIYISNIKIKELPIDLQNKFQLELQLFDINDKESTFQTSLMKQNEALLYQEDLFKILDAKNKLQAIYNPQIKTFNLIKDDSNKIVGLEIENAMILKNEIKFLY